MKTAVISALCILSTYAVPIAAKAGTNVVQAPKVAPATTATTAKPATTATLASATHTTPAKVATPAEKCNRTWVNTVNPYCWIYGYKPKTNELKTTTPATTTAATTTATTTTTKATTTVKK